MAYHSEYDLQKAVCCYLKLQYPNVIFRSDLGGIKLSKGMAIKYSRLQHSAGFPDLFIYCSKKGFGGMALELKAKQIYKKDGSLRKDEHLAQQARVLKYLNDQNFKAHFAVGIDEAIKFIDDYLC